MLFYKYLFISHYNLYFIQTKINIAIFGYIWAIFGYIWVYLGIFGYFVPPVWTVWVLKCLGGETSEIHARHRSSSITIPHLDHFVSTLWSGELIIRKQDISAPNQIGPSRKIGPWTFRPFSARRFGPTIVYCLID
jgi:hypothetical protein